MEPMQQTLFGGEEPMRLSNQQFGDAELEQRLGRRDTNRGMWANRISPVRGQATVEGTGDFSTLEERGVPARSGNIQKGLPGPNENGAWFRMSKREFVPRNELGSMQNYVSEDRLNEIKQDPGTGNNPRFPAGHEVPRAFMVKNTATPSGKEHVLVNGNHRTAALLDEGALFIEAQTIPATRRAQETTKVYRGIQGRRRLLAGAKNTPHEPAFQRPTLQGTKKKNQVLRRMGLR